MSWIVDLLLEALEPSWWRGPKRTRPRSVIHVDADGRVVAMHERGDACERCRARGAVG